uniref:Secreted protein n=1 Tax=Mesocestoides corti TaxID=53468 RepID=A0A5K3FKR7_MESCO
LLTNHKPEPHARRLPFESTTLATPLITYCSSFAIRMQRDTVLAKASVVQYVCALRRRPTIKLVFMKLLGDSSWILDCANNYLPLNKKIKKNVVVKKSQLIFLRRLMTFIMS